MIYLDNAASTEPLPSVLETLARPDLQYNPSGMYSQSGYVNSRVEKARRDILSCFVDGDSDDLILFTSGATESNNLALRTVAATWPHSHMIASCIEHASVLNTLEILKKQSMIEDYTLVPVYKDGIVDPGDIDRAVRPNTSCVCVMAVNNEIGTVQPLDQIGLLCDTHNIVFMTDATQAIGNVRFGTNPALLFDARFVNADIVTFSAHKFHGPMGVGGLYMRSWLRKPNVFMGGGHQELQMRPGTENAPAIVAMAEAMDNILHDPHVSYMQALLCERLSGIEGVSLNGHAWKRSPNNVNVRVDGCSGELLTLKLATDGICIGTGSACNNSSINPSHVLKAIGLTDEEANSSVRITLSRLNTNEEIFEFIDKFRTAVDFCRNRKSVL